MYRGCPTSRCRYILLPPYCNVLRLPYLRDAEALTVGELALQHIAMEPNVPQMTERYEFLRGQGVLTAVDPETGDSVLHIVLRRGGALIGQPNRPTSPDTGRFVPDWKDDIEQVSDLVQSMLKDRPDLITRTNRFQNADKQTPLQLAVDELRLPAELMRVLLWADWEQRFCDDKKLQQKWEEFAEDLRTINATALAGKASYEAQEDEKTREDKEVTAAKREKDKQAKKIEELKKEIAKLDQDLRNSHGAGRSDQESNQLYEQLEALVDAQEEAQGEVDESVKEIEALDKAEASANDCIQHFSKLKDKILAKRPISKLKARKPLKAQRESMLEILLAQAPFQYVVNKDGLALTATSAVQGASLILQKRDEDDPELAKRQRWKLSLKGHLINESSCDTDDDDGFVLDIDNGNEADGARLITWPKRDKNPHPHQLWELRQGRLVSKNGTKKVLRTSITRDCVEMGTQGQAMISNHPDPVIFVEEDADDSQSFLVHKSVHGEEEPCKMNITELVHRFDEMWRFELPKNESSPVAPAAPVSTSCAVGKIPVLVAVGLTVMRGCAVFSRGWRGWRRLSRTLAWRRHGLPTGLSWQQRTYLPQQRSHRNPLWPR